MKTIFQYLLLTAACAALGACQDFSDDTAFTPETPELSFVEESIIAEKATKDYDLSIKSNLPWRIECDKDWVSFDPSYGQGDATITVTVAANRTLDERTATISAYVIKGENTTLPVTQAAASASDLATHYYVKTDGSADKDGLTWETVSTYDLGLDWEMLNGRLSIVADIYRKNTTDMYVVGPELPAVFGNAAPKGNYADMRTDGWEASMSWRDNIKLGGKDFSYNLKFAIWDNVTKVTKYMATTNTLPTNYGFYRLYNYNFSVSASTTVYGMYDFTKKSRNRKIQAIRHTLTPSIGFSYAPDFSDPKYGYYKTRQTDSTGRFTTYSPYAVNAYGVPSSGRSMSMNFSLSQNLEMKVLSKRDTSGVKKIKLIDELRISGSYNFLADSMGLSNIPVSFRTTLFNNFGINLSLTLDPYRVSPEGKRYNKLFFPGRVVSTGWSFGYTFKSRSDRSETAINDITSIPPEYQNPFYDPYGQMDPVLRRQYMAQSYYDFSLPWNFGFNYAVNYSISYTNNGTTGYRKNVTQTVGFNGSLNVTPKTGITFQGGYDIKANKLTTSSVSITRDLHCWQMSFSWIPFGYHRSWSFNIGVKAASLSDLKYDKSQSMYDNMY